MNRRQAWRARAAWVVEVVLAQVDGQPFQDIRKALDDAYPFKRNEHRAFRIWHDEIERQQGLDVDRLLARTHFDRPDIDAVRERRGLHLWTLAQLNRLSRHSSWMLLSFEDPGIAAYLGEYIADARKKYGHGIRWNGLRRGRQRRQVQRGFHQQKMEQKNFRGDVRTIMRVSDAKAYPRGLTSEWFRALRRKTVQHMFRRGEW